MMSISEQERQVLDSIETGLARSAPKLNSMLAIFSRLTAGEAMPAREPARRAVCRQESLAALPRRARPRRQSQAWWLVWLAVAIAIVAVLLSFTHGGGGTACPVSRITACHHQPAAAHPKAWRPGWP